MIRITMLGAAGALFMLDAHPVAARAAGESGAAGATGGALMPEER